MTPMAYEYVASGAAEEHTVRWNREAFDRIRLRPRVLRDVASVDTRVTLLGREHAFPILLAPTAYHRVLHPEGEIATARGAAAAGITWIVSIGTTTPIREIAGATRRRSGSSCTSSPTGRSPATSSSRPKRRAARCCA